MVRAYGGACRVRRKTGDETENAMVEARGLVVIRDSNRVARFHIANSAISAK